MRRELRQIWPVAAGLALLHAASPAQASTTAQCEATVTAQVVALDQNFFYNRYGAANPAGMMFALRHDVVASDTGKSEAEGGQLTPGNIQLRSDKRPRPLTLRINQGQCLKVEFTNLLASQRTDGDQPTTRQASVHVAGLPLVNSIADDGSHVGRNASSLAAPGETRTYTLYAAKQGVFMLQSTGSLTGGEGNNAAIAAGLFGAVNVEPRGAEWYRSQLTANELDIATVAQAQTGHPMLDYDAVYPAGHRLAGSPILRMVDSSNRLVHSDLNAVITGPHRGKFPARTHQANGTEGVGRSRDEPFREFTTIFHDEIVAHQAFPGFFNDPVFGHTLHSVRDGFAINYGTGGAGAEILANRLGVGPAYDCVDCKYEEFFLTSWAVGDPAMVVDMPANQGLETLAPGQVPPADAVGPKATKALYPDDPSNVHHSYLGDHVRFRNLHVGPHEHHIFHLHAHQWLYNPDEDGSSYLDSQSIGPGSGYTYEIAYNGSGNRNRSPGDAIFHCHFYPHFAQGMWSLWRVHDVFEAGTKLDQDGRPLSGSRALPDGEIAAGTPIPAVVPLPALAMAPVPAPVSIANGQAVIADESKNPGYPFFVAGKAGHRPPRPPLDVVDDGGLPRHIALTGEAHSVETRLDFSKEVETLDAIRLPEEGTPVERAAMAFHAQASHTTVLPELKDNMALEAEFLTNGHAPIAGAPFADPCFTDDGKAPANRLYKIAVIQTDLTLNKVGWHMPQARIGALWGDVADVKSGKRAPEPLVFRANSNECVIIHHTNLVPKVYALDDFQVRTPTDIIGQHVHLVKFDVTASDGSGNGYNYEDGTLSPEEVAERVAAINRAGGLQTKTGPLTLAAKPHPYFGVAGAQTTVQRWYVDEVINRGGDDRTLRTVFTHDHFGPSTHQQAGLYMGLAVQPKGSTWRDSETGVVMGSRFDGGPTSFRADIIPPNEAKSYREFVMMLNDFMPAYESGGGVASNGQPRPDPAKAIAPPPVNERPLPFLVGKPQICPGGVALPCPEAVAAGDTGTWVLNYRQEPLAHRVYDAARKAQARNQAGDLSMAFLSSINRTNNALNRQPNVYPALSKDVRPGDPFTPLLRAYHGDNVQLRMLAGAHEEGHFSSINGMKWLLEPDNPRSGWRNHHFVALSQHFEFEVPVIPGASPSGSVADHLYRLNTSSDGLWHGMWGLLRSYRNLRSDLKPLPNNNPSGAPYINEAEFNGVCPKSAPVRRFDVTAIRAGDALPGGRLVYNSRTGAFAGFPGPLNDPTAMLYVRSSDLVGTGRSAKLRDGAPIEPLVLRAAAGECIEVQLRNNIFSNADQPGYNTLPLVIENFNANQLLPSLQVGMHPQMVAVDVTRDDGMNVGMNATLQTVGTGESRVYRWYAGDLKAEANRLVATPVEFGATNLMPADPIKQGSKGLIGALIIEPQGANWVEDNQTRTMAVVTKPNGEKFRELVAMLQDEVNLRDNNGNSIPNCCGEDGNEPENAGGRGVNYKVEPMWFRKGYRPDLPLEQTDDFDMAQILSNQAGGNADPQTPVFTAKAGDKVRMRLLQASATNRNGAFTLHGHVWPRAPYIPGAVASQVIAANETSLHTGTIEALGAGAHYDIVLDSAGGPFKVRGDYLVRDTESNLMDGGRWGLLRVD